MALSGCATSGVSVDEIPYPLPSIKKAIQSSLPMGVRKVSQNGRVFYSKYFLKIGDSLEDATKLGRRKFAKASVLGDSRPYELKIQVIFEKRESSEDAVIQKYGHVGYDTRQAQSLAKKIIKKLSKGREGANFIDDFRVF